MARSTFLFKHVLGKRFEELPPALRTLLAGPDARWYQGTATITRGSNTLSHLLGGLIGLPRKAQEVSVSLEVVPGVHRETWTRHFGRKKLRTEMRARGRAGRGRIVERFGLVSLTLELTVEGGELVYRTLSARMLGVPLPRFLAPSVQAVATEVGGKLAIESTTRAGSIGRLLRYRLTLDPAPMSAEEMAEIRQPKPAPEPAPAAEPAKVPTHGPAAATEADPDETRVLQAAGKPAPTPDANADTGEETIVARPSPPPGANADDTGEETIVARRSPTPPPASQRAPHPADAGAVTVPVDTEHARPGQKKSEPPKPESDAPRQASPNQESIPGSPSRRRTPPKTDT